MKRILVLYATREGQTEKIAARIAGYLSGAGAQASLLNAADGKAMAGLELDEFDLLVFGASMHAGGLEKELVDFINAKAEAIQGKPRSFFLVLLSAATKDQELREKWLQDARNKMDSQLQVPFPEIEMIAGALTYSRYPLPLKWMMRRIARQAGGDTDMSKDYEYTDWEQVERYSKRLLNQSRES